MFKVLVSAVATLAFSVSTLAATAKPVSTADVIREFKLMFDEPIVEGERCFIYFSQLEDGGVALEIKDRFGKSTRVKISPLDRVSKTRSEYENKYEVFKHSSLARSEITIQWQDDISDFHLMLKPGALSTQAWCSYLE